MIGQGYNYAYPGPMHIYICSYIYVADQWQRENDIDVITLLLTPFRCLDCDKVPFQCNNKYFAPPKKKGGGGPDPLDPPWIRLC